MKQITLVLAVLVLTSCISVPERLLDSENIYQTIVETDHNANDAYRMTNLWMVERFNSPEAVIEYQDKEEGIIAGKARADLRLRWGEYIDVEYVLTSEVKDKLARLTFKNVRVVETVGMSPLAPRYMTVEYFERFKEYADVVIDDFAVYAANYQSW